MATAVRIGAVDLQSDSGRYDARKIAAVMGIYVSNVGKIVGALGNTLSKNPDADSHQKQLAKLAYIIEAVAEALPEPEMLRRWLHGANRDLGGETPLALMSSGKIDLIKDWVEAMRTGQGV